MYNATCLIRPPLFHVFFCKYHMSLHYSALLKNTCVTQVVSDKRLPPNSPTVAQFVCPRGAQALAPSARHPHTVSIYRRAPSPRRTGSGHAGFSRKGHRSPSCCYMLFQARTCCRMLPYVAQANPSCVQHIVDFNFKLEINKHIIILQALAFCLTSTLKH